VLAVLAMSGMKYTVRVIWLNLVIELIVLQHYQINIKVFYNYIGCFSEYKYTLELHWRWLIMIWHLLCSLYDY